MTERYGSCRGCGGKGSRTASGQDMSGERTYYEVSCLICAGTGRDGDNSDYLKKELEREPEQR